MEDGVHIRLMVTRGEKSAANQVRAMRWASHRGHRRRWKTPSPAIVTQGLKLATVSIAGTPRRCSTCG